MAHIIIADDVRDMRHLLKEAVSMIGHQAYEASSGSDVMNLMSNGDKPIDLVLLDIGMPDMDGIEVLKRIREHHDGIKVCFITGSKDKATILKAVNSGCDDYLVKPVDLSILTQKVNKLLGIGDGDDFITIETCLTASVPALPIEVDLTVTQLSEVGLAIRSPFNFKPGRRMELRIPKLQEMFQIESEFPISVESSEPRDGMFLLTCSFYGLHESLRSKIRHLTVKGQKVSDA